MAINPTGPTFSHLAMQCLLPGSDAGRDALQPRSGSSLLAGQCSIIFHLYPILHTYMYVKVRISYSDNNNNGTFRHFFAPSTNNSWKHVQYTNFISLFSFERTDGQWAPGS